jgi:S-adenosylmethionine synthetase
VKTDNRILLDVLKRTPLEQQRIVLVERKGKGRPDSICDAVAAELTGPEPPFYHGMI